MEIKESERDIEREKWGETDRQKARERVQRERERERE